MDEKYEGMLMNECVACILTTNMLTTYMLTTNMRKQNMLFTMGGKDWDGTDCRRVGCSLATFVRKRKTGGAAIDAWRLNYVQLKILFDEVVGFETFMLVFSNNKLRNF